MKLKISIFVLLICCSVALRAQQAAPSNGFKIAIFDSEMLTDEKMGVKKLVAAYKSIEAEIKPKKDEVVALQTRYDSLIKEIRDTQATAPATAIAKKSEEAESLKSDIERKQQDGQRALDKKVKEVTDPIYADISKAFSAYAKQLGYDLVFDAAKMGGVLMVINNSADITPGFINDYNTRNPVVPAGVPIKTP